MADIKFFSGENIPLEMHKVCIVQKLSLIPVEERLEKIRKAGNNTFLLKNRDVFMDMLTDSGVNAMSDNQLAATMVGDDSYAGSETFERLQSKLTEIFGTEFFLPAHQGRACENILAEVFVRPGNVVPMNFHFTTTKAHITKRGGSVAELVIPEGLDPKNTFPFKGNFNIPALQKLIDEVGASNIPFLRLEAGTNLIGGQPFSLENAILVSQVCKKHGIMTVLDASLLQDNLFFIKQREGSCKDLSIREITRRLADSVDIIYFSARKLGFAKGGGLCMRSRELYERMKGLIPLYEGFLTYGGMSIREMEALTVGLEETMDEDIIAHGPEFIRFMCDELHKKGIPVVLPAGGLGCHINVLEFLPHVDRHEYPAGALASALYIAGGVRGMERGTMSEQRNPDGTEPIASMELLRLALPRRVFTLSQIKYAIDRIDWLFQNRDLIGGIRFTEEPEVLRFFFGTLEPTSDWQERLVKKFREDFGNSL